MLTRLVLARPGPDAAGEAPALRRVTIRLTPEQYGALAALAKHERRSLQRQLEVLIEQATQAA